MTATTIPAIHAYVRRLVDDPLLSRSIRWKSAGAASLIWLVLSRSPKWVMAVAYYLRSWRCLITAIVSARIGRTEFLNRFEILRRQVGNAILGKDEQITLAVICLLSDGHLLVEDLPGLGKTRLARALAESFGGRFSRVQGTPDLLPTDITGSLILDRNTDTAAINGRTDGFRIRYGPVFCNVLLFDEINRTPPRTQSALLEAMEERQATIFDETPRLPDPFFVIATQNPVEMNGTYSLPEAQLDRFLMRLVLGYPDTDAFHEILDHLGGDRPVPAESGPRPPGRSATGITPAGLLEMIHYARTVHLSAEVRDYLAAIVEATRDPRRVLLGASPRAGLALLRAARVYAAAAAADSVHPEHIQALAPHVLAHRIVLAETPIGGATQAQLDFVDEVVHSVRTPKQRR